MRGVTIVKMQLLVQVFISTHTPHARRDVSPSGSERLLASFQLTRLMRGVTPDPAALGGVTPHFNSHASCEA